MQTRRSIIAIAAGALAGAAIPAAAASIIGHADAELFAAIEHHRAARLAFETAVYRGSAIDQELPVEKTRSLITVWERTIVETDDPRWIESVLEVDRTSDVETEAACALLGIAPSTMSGVVALLQYAAGYKTYEWPDRLESDDGKKSGSWYFFLIEMLADALSDMAVPS